jgi:alpha-D-ribose 1-methylphosphonate 5-triphosphate synthase subunit PhnG
MSGVLRDKLDKRGLSRIVNFAGTPLLRELAEQAAAGKEVLVLKPAEKTMALLQVREPVRGERFFLGEALAVHCIVELDGVRGAAIQLGDDLDRVEAAATLDAAHSGDFPGFALALPRLLRLEEDRAAALEEEAETIRRTAVNFQSLKDGET